MPAGLDVARVELTHVRVSPKTVWSFVELACGDGACGIGEATLISDPGSLDAALFVARNALAGTTLPHVLDFTGNGARGTLAEAAVASALEQAVWDVESRRAGVPVWAALDGKGGRNIPLYANINRRTTDRSTDGFRASAREAVAAGFRAFKIAPFDDVTPRNVAADGGRGCVQAGIARAAAVREAIGGELELYIDCHWRFTPASAVEAIDALAELDVTWFECPLTESVDAMHEIARLRAHANARGMRLAGLEHLTSHGAFLPWLDAGAYDVVMPDVKYCGGVAELIAIARDATRRGVACSPHNPTGPVCHAASLAACSVLDAPVLLEHQWDETALFYAIAGSRLPRPAAGGCDLPSGPGLGVELRLDGLDVWRV